MYKTMTYQNHDTISGKERNMNLSASRPGALPCRIDLPRKDGTRISVSYTLFRTRRRTLALVVRENGDLEVRVPLFCREEEIQRFLLGKADWILSHIATQKARFQEKESAHSALTEEEKERLRKNCIRKMKRLLPEKIAQYEPLLPASHRPITRVTVRGQKTRWGSCSSKGSLSFNWKLAQAPSFCLDYVVVHELCHLVHMNHSQAFWNEVERILPDYRTARTWLKENGYRLDF